MHGSHAWSLYSHTSSSPRGGKLRWGEPDTALSKHIQPPCVQHYSSHFLRGLTLTTRPQSSLNMDTRCSCFRYFTGYPKRHQTHSLSAHAKVYCAYLCLAHLFCSNQNVMLAGMYCKYESKSLVGYVHPEIIYSSPSWRKVGWSFRPQNRCGASQQNCVSALSLSTEVGG